MNTPLTHRAAVLAVTIAVVLAAGCMPAPATTAGQFIIQCGGPARSAPDDPIVHPAAPGGSHLHEFYGNTSTNAYSTAASLAGQPTMCTEPGDTAAYWHPTLYANGLRVPATKSTFYYTKHGAKAPPIVAAPAGLKVVAGDATATAPQGTDVVYWGCGNGSSVSKVTSPPQCQPGDTGLTVHIIFPDCWNGTDLDSADHKSHMAYSQSVGGQQQCPATHPVSIPTLIMRFTWGKFYPAPGTLSLSSGSVDSMHADFFNAWNQPRLDQLVAACVSAGRDCTADDIAAILKDPQP